MLQLRDKRAKKWLSAFRPILLILLPIGQCIAQGTALEVDLVGQLRRKVQVVMRDYPFSEYQKDHVTYILDANVSQRLNYAADTCQSIEFLVNPSHSDAFGKKLTEVTESLGVGFDQKNSTDQLRFVIDTRVKQKSETYTERGKKQRTSKKQKKKKEVIVELPSTERIAADERYFKIQKRTEVDNSSHVKVLGWNKGKNH